MSRDPYSSSGVVGPGGGTRSPRSGRRVGELPTVDRSPSRSYASGRGSPLGGRKQRGTRSGNNSPEHLGFGSYHHHQLGSPYYSRDEDLGSPVMLEERGRSMSTGGGGGGHHRSRSASRPAMSSSAGMVARYTSLDRASAGVLDHDREFVPIREPSRERSRDRGLYLEDELYGSRSARQSPNPHMLRDSGGYIGELQHQNNDLQRELGNLKKELELTNQKLGSSMHSIKTFWSPELKKERALRKEESTKYSLINEQLKMLNSENQVSPRSNLRIGRIRAVLASASVIYLSLSLFLSVCVYIIVEFDYRIPLVSHGYELHILALEEPLRSKCREVSVSENRANARNVILTEIVAAVTSRASLSRGRSLRIRSRDATHRARR